MEKGELFKFVFPKLAMIMLLMSISLPAFSIQPARASGTIYIRADGSVDPDIAPISTVDNITYKLTDNIVVDVPEGTSAIVVERDNIVFAGDGYTVQGIGAFLSVGIELLYRSNVAIKNVKVTNFYDGIHVISSSNITLVGNNASSNGDSGIRLYSSFGNILAGNTMANNGNGISLDSSGNNNLTGNTAWLNGLGIHFWGSDNNVLFNNNASNNYDGIHLERASNNALADNTAYSNNYDGISLWLSDNNVLVGNNASNNEESGIMLNSCSNNNLTANIASSNSKYGIALVLCYRNVLSGNIASDNLYNFDVYGDSSYGLINYVNTRNTVDGKPIYYLIGVANAVYDATTNAGTIYLISCNNITIRDLNLTKNGNAVFSFDTTDSKIQNINASNNECGIHLYSSSNNTIKGNTICSNNDEGIYLEYSDNNTLSGNNASSSSNGWGIRLGGLSNYNSISGNTITNNTFGIDLYQFSNNSISGNTITNNTYGIRLSYSSSNNSISGNTFTNDGLFVGGSYMNFVENNTVNGKPLVYLEGVADYSVGDAGQVILVRCGGIRVENLNLSRTCVGVQLWETNNTIISGNTIAANNLGGILLFYSSYNRFYHNSFIANSEQFNVYPFGYANVLDDGYPSGGNYWSDYNPPDADKDKIGDLSYTIDENNTDRYPLIYPFECYEPGYVCSPDLNKDGIVNIVDVTKVARAFGCEPGDSNWSSTADMDLNEIINIVDVTKVAKEFGKEWNEGT